MHKFDIHRTDGYVLEGNELDLSEMLTESISYNYTIADRTEAILGLLGCLTYGLNFIEQGAQARMATIGNRPVVCSQQPYWDTTNATLHHSVGTWLVRLCTPRVMQWGVLFICFFSYLIAVT